ncbi:MAG: hypothetical protein E2O84_01055 [Bacteroidetes bacterium]|nr:MAG: hypothetical protein E2O84_01055 [Bacteroidota bacterium]
MSETLLAVDLGLRTGLCLFGQDGRLVWYRSRNFGTRARLKKAVVSVLNEAGSPSVIVIEGGGDLAPPWITEARRRNMKVHQLSAEVWRRKMLLPREQQTGIDAKRHADRLARKIIVWSEAKRPTSLRHDAAEAVCIGLWGVLKEGWLRSSPVPVFQDSSSQSGK